jgi:hypothetical protein
MSSLKISTIDDRTQRVPKLTRASAWRRLLFWRRVSTAWRNSAIRVSAHSRRLPNTIGEFAETAISGAASSWARL